MRSAARKQVRLEFDLIRLWAEHLELLVDNQASAKDLRESLRTEIRERIFVIYNLTQEEKNVVMTKLGAVP